LLAVACAGCGTGALERLGDEPLVPVAAAAPPARAPDRVAPSSDAPRAPREEGAVVTRAPWPIREEVGDPRARELASACGRPDGGLDRVAQDVAASRARGLGAPDADQVASLLRASGVPHVRPRVLTASGRAPLDLVDLRARLGALATPLAVCGVALQRTPHGGEIAVAIAVDALADLAPLPQRARPGEWLTLEAKLHVPARNARVLLTGPRGLPRTVPATLDIVRGIVRARFALEHAGAFLVQVVGDVEGGPRPLLEASVGTGASPGRDDDDAAPGEEPESAEDAPSLARMLDVLRASESLRPLARDARLDAVAQAHAERMAERATVAHDLGDGDLVVSASRRGVFAQRVGENVARAATLARVHRALHASPSHRLNLLDAGATRIGIGLRRGDDGFVYVCQVFGTE
jgi:hypothetical protein